MVGVCARLLAVVAAVSAQPPRGGGTSTCSNPSCSSPPCGLGGEQGILGDQGCTTSSGTETYAHEGDAAAGGTIASNAHLFSPFEAGFTAVQADIIKTWVCQDGKPQACCEDPSPLYSEGGTDVGIATQHASYYCGVDLPRIEGDEWIGVVGECGGHTNDYHFHGEFTCLYDAASGTHSSAVGEVTGYKMYGKWEDYDNQMLPYLDACGAHFGPTPDSSGASVYHYHTQDQAPFTIGCHGPSAEGGLVSIAVCRSLHTEGCDGDLESITTAEFPEGRSYDAYCPCFDADGSNVGTLELPALGTSEIAYAYTGGVTSPLKLQSTTPAPTAFAPTAFAPTPRPTAFAPTPRPTAFAPTPRPTPAPTASPTPRPTPKPTAPPTVAPTAATTVSSTIKVSGILASVARAKKAVFEEAIADAAGVAASQVNVTAIATEARRRRLATGDLTIDYTIALASDDLVGDVTAAVEATTRTQLDDFIASAAAADADFDDVETTAISTTFVSSTDQGSVDGARHGTHPGTFLLGTLLLLIAYVL